MFRVVILLLLISVYLDCGNLEAQNLQSEPDSDNGEESFSGSYHNYVIAQYGVGDGLPQSTVNDILQAKDGYIWLATYGGLVRFDGLSFTTFNRSNAPGMRSDRIISLFEQKNGTLWISTEDGFIKKEGDKFSTYLIEVGSQIYAPSAMGEDANGTLWIIVNGTAFRYEESGFVEVPILKDQTLADSAMQNSQGVWLAFDKQVVRTLGSSVIQIFDFETELESNIIDFIEYPETSGTYFMATDGDGVVRYKNDEITYFNVEDGLASRYIWGFDVDRSNTLWVTSYNGQAIWNGSEFLPFNAINSSEYIQFTSVYEDEEGNYWIGTTGEGLFKVRNSIINMIDKNQGLWNEKMLSLTRNKDGSVLFTTNCGGIYEWKNGKAISSPVNNYLPNQCVWSVFEDSKGYIWFGARELYRTRLLEEPGVIFGEKYGFEGSYIFAITEDSKGNIWVGSFDGVYVYDGDEFERYTTEDGLAYNDTRVFFEDEHQNMWIGSSAGLSVMQNDTLRTVKLRREIEISTNSPEPYIRAIHKDDDGTMWLGTYGEGIYRLIDVEISNITITDGLFDNIVSHIVEDEEGNFWMGSNSGISRINRKQVNSYLDGEAEKIISYSYGTTDGMNSAETNGGFQPNVLSDSLGRIYFPTVSGVAVVSSRDVQINNTPPRLHIESIRSGNEQIPVSEKITLPHNNPFVEIQYTALSFTNPEKVMFRYKMEGLDEDWFEAEHRREAMYTKLPPGEYNFKVIARNNDGIWNNEGASIQVSVIPPFWQTNWFYALIGLMFLSSGPTIYYNRVKHLERENERQKRFTERLIESQEKERRRIASELHDGLGQQILVIKNRAELAQLKADDRIGLINQLNEITQSANHAIQDVRSISHALRPVHLEKFGLTEALDNLLDILRRTSNIEWIYHIDNIDNLIPKNKEINFYRVIQEGCNNIIKHSGTRTASVMIKKLETCFKTVLSDEGNGFNLHEMRKLSGLGFLGMKERIEAMGGELIIQSETGEGTTITITIPLKENE